MLLWGGLARGQQQEAQSAPGRGVFHPIGQKGPGFPAAEYQLQLHFIEGGGGKALSAALFSLERPWVGRWPDVQAPQISQWPWAESPMWSGSSRLPFSCLAKDRLEVSERPIAPQALGGNAWPRRALQAVAAPGRWSFRHLPILRRPVKLG